MRFVIIGTGGAGVSAAEAIREYDDSSEIIMISAENTPPYSACILVEYLENEKNRDKVFWKGKDFYERLDITPILGKKVTKIDTEKKIVELIDEKVEYDKLLISAGGNVVMPPVSELDKKGVFTFKTLEDADNIHKWLKENKVEKAAVLGGGFIGLDAAIGLTTQGVEVTVVEALDRLLPRMLDYEMGTIVKEIMEKNGVNIIVNNKIREIHGEEKVERVKLQDGRAFDADIVIVATGVRANVDVVKDSGIQFDARDGIIVNEYMETSARDVYAAGDITQATDIVTGEKKPILLWSNALVQGSIAGYNMVGRRTRYFGSTIQTIIKIFDVPVVSDGYYEGEELKLFEKDIYKKMYIKGNRITGYMLINTRKNAGVYHSLMISKKDISEFKDIILTDKFSIGTLVGKAMQLEVL